MPGEQNSFEARLERIRRELSRQNEALAEIAPHLVPEAAPHPHETLRSRDHLAMRRA